MRRERGALLSQFPSLTVIIAAERGLVYGTQGDTGRFCGSPNRLRGVQIGQRSRAGEPAAMVIMIGSIERQPTRTLRRRRREPWTICDRQSVRSQDRGGPTTLAIIPSGESDLPSLPPRASTSGAHTGTAYGGVTQSRSMGGRELVGGFPCVSAPDRRGRAVPVRARSMKEVPKHGLELGDSSSHRRYCAHPPSNVGSGRGTVCDAQILAIDRASAPRHLSSCDENRVERCARPGERLAQRFEVLGSSPPLRGCLKWKALSHSSTRGEAG